MNFEDAIIQIPSVRILFYGDSSQTNLIPVFPGGVLRNTKYEFGLSMIKSLLEASTFPQISVDFINRFWDLDADGSVSNSTRKPEPSRITPELLHHYDQVWFFGKHLGSFHPGDDQSFGRDDNGYADSELSRSELDALTAWMNRGGGVLMTGDHSNQPTIDDNQSIEINEKTLLWNLGRAMGHLVLRAGDMRVWQGPPGAYLGQGQINTSGDNDMTNMPKQEDDVPQAIYPFFWDVVTRWTAERHWHSLFAGSPRFGSPFGIIRIMADHAHEGALQLPTTFDPAEWPRNAQGYQPKPTIVAHGTNQDNGARIGLVSAYDGQSAGVGRIVAHTTWHHFVNVNLHGFLLPDGSPSETLEILSEYFINLAWYLKPQAKRSLSLAAVLKALASTSNLRDLHGAPLNLLGRAAYQLFSTVATKGQIQDMIHLAVEEVMPPTQDHASLQLPLPDITYLLGGLVAEQQAAHNSENHYKEGYDKRPLAVAVRGITRAIRTRLMEVEAEAEDLRALLQADYQAA